MTFGDSAARLSSAASLALGWRPDEFWNSTPAELALAFTSLETAAECPDATTIDTLMRRFPDRPKPKEAMI